MANKKRKMSTQLKKFLKKKTILGPLGAPILFRNYQLKVKIREERKKKRENVL